MPESEMQWSRWPTHQIPNRWGYPRNPGFWFTLNYPYNYLYEVHRFQNAIEACVTGKENVSDSNSHMNQVSRDAMTT